jgi:hypothetical protein
MYHGITCDLDLTNETAAKWGLLNGEEICVENGEYDNNQRYCVSVSVSKGGRYRDPDLWYADLIYTGSGDDLRNSRYTESETQEEAIADAMRWIASYA